jgi:hypothetical protein
VARQRDPLDVSTWVWDFDSAILKGGSRGDRRLDRAAPAQRTTAIVNAREKALLEGVRDVRAIGERSFATGALEQLERRLAVAVFEVLMGEPMAMGAKQKIPACSRDERDHLGRI